MPRLIRRVLCRLLPPTGVHRAADNSAPQRDEPTMTLPRVTDPGPLVRPFYAEFERGQA